MYNSASCKASGPKMVFLQYGQRSRLIASAMRAVRSAPSRRALAWPAHFHSTLRRLQEPQAGSSSDGRPTVYVTGFMTDTAEAGNWEQWLTSHQSLSQELNWCDDAYGLTWRSGAGGDILGKWPFPLHTLALVARRSSPKALAAGVAADAIVNAARLYLHFRKAEVAAAADADHFAEACDRLGASSSYRVAAHSLGCRLVLDALPLLAPERRPAEVFLCAAAATPSHAADKLSLMCASGGRLYHFYSPYDEALTTGFVLASGGEAALGSRALPSELEFPGATSHDATHYLGIAAHGAYKKHFHRLAADAVLGRPPPNALYPAVHLGLVRQREMLRTSLMQALSSLPGVRAGVRAASSVPRWRWSAVASNLPPLPSVGAPLVRQWLQHAQTWRRGRGKG